MVGKENDNIEEKIIDSAADVFEEKGFAGARMQQIADKAGINKALLHYYFRSKDKLFEKVFVIVVQRAFVKFGKSLKKEGTIFEKLENFFEMHQELLWKNRNFPLFFLNEIKQNPGLVNIVFDKLENESMLVDLIDQIKREQNEGVIKSDIEPVNLLVNIISLSIFPYVGAPILSEIMTRMDSDYETFIIDHRKQVAQFVINSIKN